MGLNWPTATVPRPGDLLHWWAKSGQGGLAHGAKPARPARSRGAEVGGDSPTRSVDDGVARLTVRDGGSGVR
jgi:hypothetical protein